MPLQGKCPAKAVILLLTALFLMFHVLSADSADAAEYRAMYLKEQTFSYRTFSTDYGYAVAVLGKGERVSVSTKEYIGCADGKTQRYRKYMHYGMTTYIPSECLTTQKPKYSYRVRTAFHTLQLKEGAKLYFTPAVSKANIVCEESEVCTIGETNYWYKVFYRGNVCFIRKDSSDILKIQGTDDSNITVSKRISSGRANILNRALYYYSFLPASVRDELAADNCNIVITNYLGTQYEKKGSSGYASVNGDEYTIYIKEKPKDSKKTLYFLEGSILHEIGHILEFDLLFLNERFYRNRMEQCFLEVNLLGLDSYYRKNYREYIAETFSLYILNPDKLHSEAPETYRYFTELYEN